MRPFASKLLHVSEGQATALTPVEFSGRVDELTLERWIVDQPELVGEPLLILGRQLAEFEEDQDRLDVLALDSAGEIVLIELKVTENFRVTDLQALAYAGAYASRATDDLAQTLRRTLQRERASDSATQEVELAEARQLIVDFLAVEEFGSWQPSQQVRIKLLAPSFPRRVLKTVKWLGDVYGVPIEAITAQLFEDHDGYRHISFERLLPLPSEDEFDMTVRQREDRKRSQNTARRASVLPLLIDSGHLKDGDTLWLEKNLLPAAERHTFDPEKPAFRVQLHAENGAPPRFAWKATESDEAQLLAPSAVVYHLYEELFPGKERAFFSTAVAGSFRVDPDGQTLEELALAQGLWTEAPPEVG